MATEQSNVVNLPVSSEVGDTPSSKQTKNKPTKVLPSERILILKQLDYLRAYVATSGYGSKAVRSTEVAEVAKASVTTLHIINTFWVDIGVLQKSDAGFMPSAEVVSYARGFEWNPGTAAHKLAPLLQNTWFAQELLPKLSYRAMPEEEAIADLADTASAGPEYRKPIRMLIDLMEAAGMVARDGDNVRRSTPSASPAPVERSTSGDAAEHRETHAREPHHREVQHREPPTTRSTATTAFSQTPDGIVQFHISVKVDMAEFAGWSPDRIAAFFGGIAQVLSAKGAVEKGASTG